MRYLWTIGLSAVLVLGFQWAARGDDLAGTAKPAAEKRYYPPTLWGLGPWYGSGSPMFGKCGCGQAKTFVEEVRCQLENIEKHDLPVTVYLADGHNWGGPRPDGHWRAGQDILDRLKRQDIRLLLHYWGGGANRQQWQRAYADVGARLGGFYFDDNSLVAQNRACIDYMQSIMPGDSEVIMKAYQSGGDVDRAALGQFANICYVNDLDVNWDGLREGVRRVFSTSAAVPALFNEFTAYWFRGGKPDEETYFRRLHFGAMQVVMAQTPYDNCDPWEHGYSPRLLAAFRYWSWVHWELAPYLYSYVYHAYETNEPVFRAPDAERGTTRLGDEIFVAYVMRPGVKKLQVTLPPGEWIDYWDPAKVCRGSVECVVPPGREPIFIRSGAMVPMRVKRAYTGNGTRESEGSLTVRVFPAAGSTSLRYRDPALGQWIKLGATLAGDQLTLTMDKRPSSPVLFRVERCSEPPRTVATEGLEVRVNQGGSLPRADSEAAVNSSPIATWHHDPERKLLIIKVPTPSEKMSPRKRP